MKYTDLGCDEVLARFSDLRQAPLNGTLAPHKPLLILLMLARHRRGEAQSDSWWVSRSLCSSRESACNRENVWSHGLCCRSREELVNGSF